MELRVPGDFFSSLLTLCYCVLHLLRHFVHWNRCIKAMCSAVACCNSIVLCHPVCANRSGMAAARFHAAAAACGILITIVFCS